MTDGAKDKGFKHVFPGDITPELTHIQRSSAPEQPFTPPHIVNSHTLNNPNLKNNDEDENTPSSSIGFSSMSLTASSQSNSNR